MNQITWDTRNLSRIVAKTHEVAHASLHSMGQGTANTGRRLPWSQQSWSRPLSFRLLAPDSTTQDLTHHLRCANEQRFEPWAMASREAGWCGYEYKSSERGLTPDRVGRSSTDDHCNTLKQSSLSYPRAEHRKATHSSSAKVRWYQATYPASSEAFDIQ